MNAFETTTTINSLSERIDTLERVNRSLTYDRQHAYDDMLDLRAGEYIVVTADGVWCNFASYEDAERTMHEEDISGVILRCESNFA